MAERLAARRRRYETETYRAIQGRFTAHLRRVREARGLTQEQCAAACGMPMQQFQQIESGEANITFATLARVADGLGLDVAELFAPLPKR